MGWTWTAQHLEMVRDYPHLIGHLAGKDKLTSLHSDWILYLWNGPRGVHRSLMAHRGAYKTTACTEIGIIYDLLFHPSDRVALIRETYTEAARTLETIKKYMRLEPIRALFEYAHGQAPEEFRSAEGQVLYSFKRSVTKEPSIAAYGINQVPTGSHFDRIAMDDIVTINSRLSRAQRERVKQGVLEVMTNIIDPGHEVINVGTPWHHDDAWAMRNEAGELVIPEALKFRPEDTGILSPEDLEQKRRTTTRALFAINYNLDTSVRDEGQIFDEPHYAEWRTDLPRASYHAHVDAAWDGLCTNALTIMAPKPDGRIQAYGRMFPGNMNDYLRDSVKDMHAHQSRILHMETNADKGYLARDFRKTGPYPPSVLTYAEAMNKDIKIACYLKKYWDLIDWAPDTDPEYLLQIKDYRVGQDPRDCADSAASLLREHIYKVDPGSGGRSSLYDM